MILKQYTGIYCLQNLWWQARETTQNRLEAFRLVLFILSGGHLGFFNADKLAEQVRSNERLAFYKSFRHLEPHLFLSDDKRKVVYLPVTRAASSNILSYMLELKTIKDQLSHPNIRTIQTENLIRDYASEGYFIFSFVRNPYARLVSFFQQKYSFNAKAGVYIATSFNQTDGLKQVDSFADLVHRIRYIPDSVIDRHLLPQARILFPFASHRKFISYVGKLENLKEDFAEVAKHYKKNHASLRINGELKMSESWRSSYDGRLADIVYKRYKVDFIEFGYSRKID